MTKSPRRRCRAARRRAATSGTTPLASHRTINPRPIACADRGEPLGAGTANRDPTRRSRTSLAAPEGPQPQNRVRWILESVLRRPLNCRGECLLVRVKPASARLRVFCFAKPGDAKALAARFGGTVGAKEDVSRVRGVDAKIPASQPRRSAMRRWRQLGLEGGGWADVDPGNPSCSRPDGAHPRQRCQRDDRHHHRGNSAGIAPRAQRGLVGARTAAAIAAGTRTPMIILRHILPNTLAPITVQAYVCASAMLAEAILSFIGAGTPPTVP